MQSTLIAVDLAKNVFEIAVSRKPGKVAERHRLLARSRSCHSSPSASPRSFCSRRPARRTTGAASCASSATSRCCCRLERCKRYRDGNKTDRTDAKSLLEASRNEEIRPVPLKSVAQQTLTSLHRLRSAWMATRTARINTVRGLLRELGRDDSARRSQRSRPLVIGLLADPESAVPVALRALLGEACEEIGRARSRIKSAERQLEALAKEIPAVRYLRSIPGSRSAHRDRSVRLRRRRSSLPHRAPLRELPRLDSEGALERQPAAARTHLEARRHLPALSPDPRRASRPARSPRQDSPTRPARLGARRPAAPRSQRRRHRARQQARPHRLGGLASGTLLQVHALG